MTDAQTYVFYVHFTTPQVAVCANMLHTDSAPALQLHTVTFFGCSIYA